MTDDRILVCMLATEALFVTAGWKPEHRCARCGEYVVVAPSGVAMLKQYPIARILCLGCLQVEHPTIKPGEVELAGPVEQIIEEVLTAVPNTWRGRN